MKLYFDINCCSCFDISASSLCGQVLKKIDTVYPETDRLSNHLSDIAKRVFLALALDLLAVGDLLRWTAMTLMVIPAYRIGIRAHLFNLISSLAMPILGISIVLCSCAPATSEYRPFSFFPQQQVIDRYFLNTLFLDADNASLNLSGIKQAVKNKSVPIRELELVLFDAIRHEHHSALPIILESCESLLSEERERKIVKYELVCSAQEHFTERCFADYNFHIMIRNEKYKQKSIARRYAILCQLIRAGALFYREEMETARTSGKELLLALKQLNTTQELDRVKELYQILKKNSEAEAERLKRRVNPYCSEMVMVIAMGEGLGEFNDTVTIAMFREYGNRIIFCFENLAKLAPQLEATHRSMQAYRVQKLYETMGGDLRAPLPKDLLAIVVEYGAFRSYVSEREVPAIPAPA